MVQVYQLYSVFTLSILGEFLTISPIPPDIKSMIKNHYNNYKIFL
ncbi:hypothetical protein PL9214290646 [Planktothrix tepida PCC 9214]|uniref:Uncharacterized protein n=1 Tax=Planktothrix tepida PCC 9214 TaxID=671072 RepID=A0A1J1LEQ6_9CYAN|nr:hypothetical protein PL9214290646 [Planktothrix tepida PCC 9214]